MKIIAVSAFVASSFLASSGVALASASSGKVAEVLQTGDQRAYRSPGGHNFKIKTVTFEETGTPGEYYVDGRLTHDLRGRPDDKYHYCLKINKAGELLEFNTHTNRGGFTKMLTTAQGAVNNSVTRKVTGKAAGVAISALPYGGYGKSTAEGLGEYALDLNVLTSKALTERMGRSVGTLIDGDWLPAANEVAAEVAIQAARALKTGNPNVKIYGSGEKLDRKIISRCPRRQDKSLH
ncbi:MAG: hypothetical protein ACR2JJ_11705 [Sphingomicrobium sp.]